MVIDALRDRFSASVLRAELGISRSSYCYSRAAELRPDPCFQARQRIRRIFEQSKETFGSERMARIAKRG